MMEHEKKLMDAMVMFKHSYEQLLTAIGDYEDNADTSINYLTGFTEKYPFDKSFDELDVQLWVNSVVAGLKQPNFKVLNYEYLNTGGSTMVGIHEVWLPDEVKTVYVYTNEEGCTMSAVDYIRNEVVVHDYDEVVIENVDIGRLTGYEKYFELYRRCINDYIKDDCKYFGITRRLPYYLLSDELQELVTEDYSKWLEAEKLDDICTDGKSIVEDPDYTPTAKLDSMFQKIQDFKEWHNSLISKDTTDEEFEEMYDCEYTLTFKGHSVQLPFYAETFNNVDSLLKSVIEDW